MLQPGKRKGELVMAASEAAPRLFNPGGTSAEDAQKFTQAVGGRTDDEARAAFGPMAVDAEGEAPGTGLQRLMDARKAALDARDQAAAFSLRNAAEENGTLNPTKAQAWLQRHAPALDTTPELRAKFQNAVAQRQQLDQLKAVRATLDNEHPLAGVGTRAELAERYWRPGAGGREAVQKFFQDAGGDTPANWQLIDDQAAELLRARAFKDGTWNDAAYQAWRNSHAEALSQRPELAAKLATVADAQRTVVDAATRRLDAVKALQDGAAAHYLTKTGEKVDPLAAVNSLMGSKTSPADAAALMREIKADPTAAAGVKRNVMDWLTNKIRAQVEAGTTGQKQLKQGVLGKILSDPKMSRTLDQIFTPLERKLLENVLTSAELSARSTRPLRSRAALVRRQISSLPMVAAPSDSRRRSRHTRWQEKQRPICWGEGSAAARCSVRCLLAPRSPTTICAPLA